MKAQSCYSSGYFKNYYRVKGCNSKYLFRKYRFWCREEPLLHHVESRQESSHVFFLRSFKVSNKNSQQRFVLEATIVVEWRKKSPHAFLPGWRQAGRASMGVNEDMKWTGGRYSLDNVQRGVCRRSSRRWKLKEAGSPSRVQGFQGAFECSITYIPLSTYLLCYSVNVDIEIYQMHSYP